jgi:serine/threonine protein phosphatase PrpC
MKVLFCYSEAMPHIQSVTSISHAGIRALNEDRVLVDEKQQVFGVFDGASSLNKYLSPDNKTGAYIAASIAADTFANTGQALKEAALEASDNIEKAHQEAGVDITSNVNRFGTTAAVVRVMEDKVELLQVGDSVILVIYSDGHAEVPLGYHDHDLDVMRNWRRLADSGAKGIRDIVADDVVKLRASANSAYGMLNGDNKVAEFIRTKTISLKKVSAILLLSDGMYIPKEDPEADENWNAYAELYLQGGLDNIYATVREIEKTDPDLIRYPRYKLHDDASGIGIDLQV